jgi:acyl-coenzyme A thioesterase PaaI-like protein
MSGKNSGDSRERIRQNFARQRRGEITKPGSNIIVADGRGYAIGDGPAKLIASMTGTMMVVRSREGITG